LVSAGAGACFGSATTVLTSSDARLDGLIGRELGLGVELEVAFGPVEGVDDRVVAGLAVALGVKKMPEQEVEGRGLPIPIADGERTGGPLALSGFQ